MVSIVIRGHVNPICKEGTLSNKFIRHVGERERGKGKANSIMRQPEVARGDTIGSRTANIMFNAVLRVFPPTTVALTRNPLKSPVGTPTVPNKMKHR